MAWSISSGKIILGIQELEMYQVKVWEDGYRIYKSSVRGSLVLRRLFRVIPRGSSLEWGTCPIKIYYKPPIHLRVFLNNFGKGLGKNKKIFFRRCYSRVDLKVEGHPCPSL
jgi:hypothetical protein